MTSRNTKSEFQVRSHTRQIGDSLTVEQPGKLETAEVDVLELPSIRNVFHPSSLSSFHKEGLDFKKDSLSSLGVFWPYLNINSAPRLCGLR